MRMRMRLRIEEISVQVCVCVCVCGETFASNCSILSSVCSELGMCANSLSSASRVFFSLSFLRLFCQQSIWTIDVAISCAALQTTSSPVPCPLSLSCVLSVCLTKCKMSSFYPSYECVCMSMCVCVCVLASLVWNNSLMYVNFVAYLYQSCHVPCAFNRKCNPQAHVKPPLNMLANPLCRNWNGAHNPHPLCWNSCKSLDINLIISVLYSVCRRVISDLVTGCRTCVVLSRCANNHKEAKGGGRGWGREGERV